MVPETVVEQRLSMLEKEVADLKQRLDHAQPVQSWLDRIVCSMKDFPEFDEVLRLGKSLRQADQATDKNP